MFKMKRALFGLLLASSLVSGCGQFGDLLGPGTLVTLVNNGDFDVIATVAFSDDPNISESDLIDSGSEIELTIPANDTRSFRRGCLSMRAVMVENAELQVIGGFGPSTRSEVIREGQGNPQMICQGFLSFTFDHNDSTLDFDVTAD